MGTLPRLGGGVFVSFNHSVIEFVSIGISSFQSFMFHAVSCFPDERNVEYIAKFLLAPCTFTSVRFKYFPIIF